MSLRMVAGVACALLTGAVPAAGQTAMEEGAGGETRLRAPRRPLHDLAGTAVDLGRDFWLTFSAPVHMDRNAWLATAGVIGVGGLLFAYDEEIMDAALRNREEPVFHEIDAVGTFLEPVGLMGNTNIWYASAAVVSWAAGWDRPKRLFTEMLYSHWIAAVIRGGVNKLVGRSRPYIGLGAQRFKLGRGTSFPSGHASTAFQVAAVLSHHIDNTPVSIALYSLATTIAYQRITAEEHWASDVWFGAACGWAVAKLVIRLHEDEALGLTPMVTPSGEPGLALRIRF